MLFTRKKQNPVVYLTDTHQYVDDLQRVTLLRDKCHNPKERGDYDTMIHCMQEVVVFMNTLTDKERKAAGLAEPAVQ